MKIPKFMRTNNEDNYHRHLIHRAFLMQKEIDRIKAEVGRELYDEIVDELKSYCKLKLVKLKNETNE